MFLRRAAISAAFCLFATAAAASIDEHAGGLPSDPAAAAGDLAIEQHAPPAPVLVVVERGDTLMALLVDTGLAAAEAHAVAAAIAPHLPPRALRPGQEIVVVPDPADPTRARAVEIVPDATRRIQVRQAETGGYEASVEETQQIRHLVRAEGEIGSSLYEDMAAEGVPPSLIMNLIRAFSHAVDFQRYVQPGDRFAVMFERFRDPDGALIQHGQGIYAELRLRDRAVRIWRHAPAGGSPDWYDEKGESVRRALLRTPLDAARISSGFGMRRHPILGYSRMHRGVDFAAPTGTPVYAAGEGSVAFAGWRGNYGRTVILRHSGGISTLYAHLSSIPAAIRPGARVRQGQVIGRVGSTGMSTGPHLHYEVHRNNVAVNPASIRMLAGRNLQGRDLAAFRTERARIDRRFTALAGVAELAAAD
ncbi:M23 family metallopeptidase [Elioraea sp.]|uniref:M23 family metallopeptidase n=1 Tax=Elioraea sp. TaxID=2185103 RepID=UPI003F702351